MKIKVSIIKWLWLRRAAIVLLYLPTVILHAAFNLLRFSVAALIWLGLSLGQFAIKLARSIVVFHASAVEQWQPTTTKEEP